MRKILLLAFVFSFFNPLNKTGAQCLIPNGSFSDWTNDTVADSWNGVISFDLYIYTYTMYTAHRTADAYSAPSACIIRTDKTIPILGTLLPGTLSLGSQNLDILNMSVSYSGGIPVSVKPTNLKGYYKYEFPAKDTFSIQCICKKDGSIIGTGELRSEISKNVYTYFDIPINYSVPDAPDSFNIICVSSAGNDPKNGTSLYLDDLELDYEGSGTPESVAPDNLIRAYPNPTSGKFFLSLNAEGIRIINIYDRNGRLILSKKSFTAVETMDLNNSPNGMYLIEILMNKEKSRKWLTLIH